MDQTGPTVSCIINGIPTPCLIDTGASRSTLRAQEFPSVPLSTDIVTAVGVGNSPIPHPVTSPLSVSIGPLSDYHAFLLSPCSPVNLLGKDLLCKLNCTIFCTPDGVFLEVPDPAQNEVLALLQGGQPPPGDAEPGTSLLQQELLAKVSPSLWADHANQVGRIGSAQPVKICVNPAKPLPRIRQYPLSKQAEDGIRPVITALLEQGVIVPTVSKCNSPIFPVRKPGKQTWRFVQDLRAINAVIVPSFPVVPNPATILSCIPFSACYFSVIDLCSAFFSIPIHKDSQYLFAFTYQGFQYTWTRLPQGYTESPTIFSQILKRDLDDIKFLMGSVLIQYVDDLLLASDTLEASKADTLILLQALAQKGHKASKAKLQLCLPLVRYLGHDISAGQRGLSPSRVQAILQIPKPITKKQMRGFLGMAGYCRQWIPGYASLVRPLYDLTLNRVSDPIFWTEEAENAFQQVKCALAQAPALGLPDYKKPFTLYCHEKDGSAQGVLTQLHGDKNRPVAYFSSFLDSVAVGLPPCLRSVAAAATLVEASATLVLGNPLTVAVPHAVTALLTKGHTQHLSNSRLTKYELLLLNAANVTLVRCPVLNPASLLPTAIDGEPHDCLSVTAELITPRADLQDVPLQNPDLIFFVDGSCLRNSAGQLMAGYAVCDLYSIIEAFFLPTVKSAQIAELFALTRACHLATGHSVTIYTDSRYAFGVVHDYGQLWKYRGFLTSSGSPICNGSYVSALLFALQLPSSIAIVKCLAHRKPCDDVTRGNALADAAARQAALSGSPAPTEIFPLCVLQPLSPATSSQDLARMQESAPEKEKVAWKLSGCSKHPEDALWHDLNGRLVAPQAFLPYLARLAHGLAHVGKGGMIASVARHWYAPKFSSVAQHYCNSCSICLAHNSGKPIRTNLAAHPVPWGPFVNIQIDFISMPTCCSYEYVLVCVCVCILGGLRPTLVLRLIPSQWQRSC